MSRHKIDYMPTLNASGGWDVIGHSIPPCSYLTAAVYGFKNSVEPSKMERFFWAIAEVIWNNEDLPEPLLEKNPWSEKIIRACCREKYIAIGGAASSGKSHIVGAWGIVQWLAAPQETMILITSTDLKGAKQRVWKSIIDMLNVADGLPIKQRNSVGSANFVDSSGKVLESAGLMIVAAGNGKEHEAAGKLIGLHQKRIVLIVDEMSELSSSIMHAGLSNLANNEMFQMIGMSNPNSRFDPFGIWAEPKNGWDSIVVERDYHWKTRWGGYYLRLDGERSPNIEAGEVLYPYLPTADKLHDAKSHLGENSRGYLRMYRAVFFDSDEAEGIYNEADLQRSGALHQVQLQRSVKIAACDPAFTSGGDRSILVIGEIGYDNTGQFVLQFTDFIHMRDDATLKSIPRTHQIVRKIKEECQKRNIQAYDFGIDATGAGNPFADVLAGEWSPDFLRVQFGGKASDLRAAANSRQTGKELYYNRVTELWFSGKDLIRCKQIKGITPDLAREMCSRNFDTIKGNGGLLMRVESKTDLKSRMGFSPDYADAAFVLVELARQRHGLLPIEPPEMSDASHFGGRQRRSFKDLDVLAKTQDAFLL